MRRAVLVSILTLGCYGSSDVGAPKLDGLQLTLAPYKNISMSAGQLVRVSGALVLPNGASIVNSAPLSLTSRDTSRVAIEGDTWIRGARSTPGVRVLASASYQGQSYSDSLLVVVSCTQELLVTVTPRQIDFAVGDSLTITVIAISCGGRDTTAFPASGTWWTSDVPGIVAADSATGRVRGISAGTTQVRGRVAGGGVRWSVPVTVR